MPRRRKRQRIGESESPLRQLRENADLTQEQLAVYVGVAVSSIRRWEKGDEPTMTVLQMRAFCRAVRVAFDQLPNHLSLREMDGDRDGADEVNQVSSTDNTGRTNDANDQNNDSNNNDSNNNDSNNNDRSDKSDKNNSADAIARTVEEDNGEG